MHSMLIKFLVFLALDTLAIARPQTSTPTDSITSGNYRITSCGPRAPAVKNRLALTYLWTKTANLSMKSPAYAAFFDNSNQPSVANAFECITEGYSVSGDIPNLVCVNNETDADAEMRWRWERCQTYQDVLFLVEDTADIMLCPQFFEMTLGPQHSECPAVNSGNTGFIPSAKILVHQYGFLILALANLYIPKATTRPPLAPRVREVNECMGLKPEESVLNPPSYAYFTSCKLALEVCVPPSITMSANRVCQVIRAGCTKFPKSSTVDRDRELMEVSDDVDSNRTNLVTFECSGSNANSTCSG